MELLLIRHALPIRREVTDGAADPHLAPEGFEQAKYLGAYLASEQLDAVYASPLRRAQETAAAVVAGRGIEPIIEVDVAEYDRNSPEYVPMEQLKAAGDPRWQAMVDGEWDSDETQADFNARVNGAIERIIANHAGQRVAIVCHGGVINAYLTMVIGLQVDGQGFFYPNYTSIHRVAASSAGIRSVVTVNETSHLRGTGLPMGMFQHG